MIIAFLNHHYISSPQLTPGTPANETNNWGVLLLGFLSFYGKDFDFKTTGISITPGRSTFPLLPPYSYPPHHSTFSHSTASSSTDNSDDDSNNNQTIEDSNTETSPANDSLQFPLDHPHSHTHTHTHSPFSITPPMYLEDPIRKGKLYFIFVVSFINTYSLGNNIGSHAFLLNRVQAAFEFAKNALKGLFLELFLSNYVIYYFLLYYYLCNYLLFRSYLLHYCRCSTCNTISLKSYFKYTAM